MPDIIPSPLGLWGEGLGALQPTQRSYTYGVPEYFTGNQQLSPLALSLLTTLFGNKVSGITSETGFTANDNFSDFGPLWNAQENSVAIAPDPISAQLQGQMENTGVWDMLMAYMKAALGESITNTWLAQSQGSQPMQQKFTPPNYKTAKQK